MILRTLYRMPLTKPSADLERPKIIHSLTTPAVVDARPPFRGTCDVSKSGYYIWRHNHEDVSMALSSREQVHLQCPLEGTLRQVR